MQKFSFIIKLFLALLLSGAICYAQDLDTREGDDGERPNPVYTRIGIGHDGGCCNVSCKSSCDTDIAFNYSVMSQRVAERLSFLQQSWQEILNSFQTIKEIHTPMMVSTLTKGTQINTEAVESLKRMQETQNYKILVDLTSQLELLSAEADLLKIETEMLKTSLSNN